MSTTLNKLEYTDETKTQIKTALNTNFNAGITDNDTFRSYVSKINNIYTNWEKVTGEGTELTLNNTKKGKMVLGLKGNTSQETTTGKNLLPNNATTITFLGVTFTINPDKSVTLNGTSTGNAYINLYISPTESIVSDTSKTYTFSKGISNNNIALAIYENINGEWTAKKYVMNDTVTYTPSGQQTGQIFRILVENGKTLNNVTVYPMLVEGTTVGEYEPYTGGQPSPSPDYKQDIHVVTGENSINIENEDGTSEQNYPVNLGSIELCKIGDYQDYLYRENGNWYKYGVIGKVVFDGSENWIIRSDFSYDNLLVLIKSDYVAGEVISNSQTYCDYFQPLLSQLKKTGIRLVDANGFGFQFQISKTIATTVEEFKTWLSTHNTTVYYPLDTPTTTLITDETLVSQLEAIYKAMSYDIQTNISQNNDDLPFIISASALMKGGN